MFQHSNQKTSYVCAYLCIFHFFFFGINISSKKVRIFIWIQLKCYYICKYVKCEAWRWPTNRPQIWHNMSSVDLRHTYIPILFVVPILWLWTHRYIYAHGMKHFNRGDMLTQEINKLLPAKDKVTQRQISAGVVHMEISCLG